MVLHDINQAAQYSDRLIVLKRGVIHYDGLPHCVLCKEMFQSILEIDADIYTKVDVLYSLRKNYVKKRVINIKLRAKLFGAFYFVIVILERLDK